MAAENYVDSNKPAAKWEAERALDRAIDERTAKLRLLRASRDFSVGVGMNNYAKRALALLGAPRTEQHRGDARGTTLVQQERRFGRPVSSN
jgi:hypothetical protein